MMWSVEHSPEKMMKKSIRTWLIVPFIGFFLLPLLILGGLLALQNYLVEEERVKQEQQKVTELASETVSSFLRKQEQMLHSLVYTNYLPAMSLEKTKSLLTLFQSAVKDDMNNPVFNALSLLDERGLELIRVTRKSLVLEQDLGDFSGEDVFRIPLTKEDLYYSPVYFNEENGEPYIALSLPIKDLRTKAVPRVIVAEINLKSI